MYKILERTDWSFLLGGEVEQLCIGLHQLQLCLSKDIRISFESDFSHTIFGRGITNEALLMQKAITLVSLLGKRIERVRPKGEEALTIDFGGDETLTLMVKSGPFESFQVTTPSQTIVV